MIGGAGPNVFASAVDWLNATVLGTLASTVAVLAVASIGFLLLAGRVEVRRAVQVILGCFILFGASTIADGIMAVLTSSEASGEIAVVPPPPPAQPMAQAAPAAGTVGAFDPYAGAALPTRP